MITLGNKNITECYIGNKEVVEIYKGTQLIYSKHTEPSYTVQIYIKRIAGLQPKLIINNSDSEILISSISPSYKGTYNYMYTNTEDITYIRFTYGIEKIDISISCDTLTSLNSTFYGQEINSIFFSTINTTNVTNMSKMFYECKQLTTLDLSLFNTVNVTDMSYMFYDCYKLTSLDLSNFNTYNVTDMSGMFDTCVNLTSLKLTNFKTINVENMSHMFASCRSLKILDISMFWGYVKNISHMFWGCEELTTLYCDQFNPYFAKKEYDTIGYMFSNCNKLNYIRCTQSFKEWCWQNQNIIQLPEAMREGGSGTWEIVS